MPLMQSAARSHLVTTEDGSCSDLGLRVERAREREKKWCHQGAKEGGGLSGQSICRADWAGLG